MTTTTSLLLLFLIALMELVTIVLVLRLTGRLKWQRDGIKTGGTGCDFKTDTACSGFEVTSGVLPFPRGGK